MKRLLLVAATLLALTTPAAAQYGDETTGVVALDIWLVNTPNIRSGRCY